MDRNLTQARILFVRIGVQSWLETEAMANEPKQPRIETKLARELQLPSAVLGFTPSRDGASFYCACMNGGIYKVDSEGKEKPQRIGGHQSYASSIHLLP